MGKISVPAELVQAIDTASAIVLRDVIKTIGAECPDGRVMAKEMLSSAPEHVRKTKRVLANIVMVICEGVGDAKVITERILGINEVKKRNMENIFGGSSAGTGRMDMFTFSDIKRTNQIEVDDVPYSSFAGSVKRRKTSVHGSDSCCEESSTRTKSDHQVANIKPPTFGANSGRDMVTANTSTDSRLQSKRKKTVNEIFAADSQRREAEALMEEQRRRAEIEWSNTRTSCGRCNMQYYPDYNRHGDCVWHSGMRSPPPERFYYYLISGYRLT
jgi:hypothetical protein